MTVDPPRLDDLDFDQIVAEATARIPVHNPEWTHHSESDPGITLLQLFAFVGESILYRANRVPERNRRAFLRLLGLAPRPAMPARGIVTFDSTRSAERAMVLPRDTEVRAGAVPFRTERAIDVLPVSAVVCAKTAASAAMDATERARYLAMYEDYGVDATDVALYDTTRLEVPAGGATYRPVEVAETLDQSLWVALLAESPEAVGDVRDLIAGRTITLGVMPAVEDASRVLAPRSTRREGDAPRLTVSVPVPQVFGEFDDKRPRYRDLATAEDGDVVQEPGTVTVELPGSADQLRLWELPPGTEPGFGDFPPVLDDAEAERLVTWLRVRRRAPAADATRLNLRIAWLGVNAVAVTQRQIVPGERVGRGTGRPDQTARLTSTPVLADTVELEVGDVRWTRTDDLITAPPEVGVGRPVAGAATAGPATVFTVQPDGTVVFGDGLHGARPPVGAEIVASYATGGGRAGLVPVGAISTALGVPAGVKVTNPVRTWGAADGETLDEAERRMALTVRHQERCVTAADFRDIAERTPGVALARVEVLPLFHPELGPVEAPGVVTVMVIPAHDPAQPQAPRPDRMFLDTVCEHLDARRLVTTELHVRGPVYVPVTVSVGFDTEAGRSLPPVREAVAQAVRRSLSPLPPPTGDRWRLGRSLDPREVVTEVARVPGVSRVNGVLMTASGVPVDAPRPLSGLELPQLVGLAVQPGDPTPVDLLTGSGGDDPRLLPVPAIPEEC